MVMIQLIFPLSIKIQITQAKVIRKEAVEVEVEETVEAVAADAVVDLDLVFSEIKAKTVLDIARVAARTPSKLRRTWQNRISNSMI